VPLSPLVEVIGWLRQDPRGTLVAIDASERSRLGVTAGERVFVVIDEQSPTPQTVEAIMRSDGWLQFDAFVTSLSPMVRVRRPRRLVTKTVSGD
jgi:hypothetical protein